MGSASDTAQNLPNDPNRSNDLNHSNPLAARRLAFFFDIDGTLLPHGAKVHTVSPRFAEALRAAGKKGHLFFLNSGRGLSFIPKELIRSADFDGIVAGLGSYAEFHGKELFSDDIPADIARILLTYCEAHGEVIRFEGIGIDEADDGVIVYVKHPPENVSFGSKTFTEIADAEDALRLRRMTKITVPYLPSGAYRALLEKYFTMVYQLPGGKGSVYAEGALLGNSKGSGIGRVCAALGIPIEDTVAVGDSANDYGMFAAAGLSVAMDNATDDVKAHCRMVCGDVEADGAAELVEKLTNFVV